MNTPICDFVEGYAAKNPLRLHMPGHKGNALLGVESLDITEIPGADSLYEASGILRESEDNASRLFGCPTFYSTEGSSQCIRAMVHLACLDAKRRGRRPVVAAGRNAHKVFLSAAALLDFEVKWLYGSGPTYLSCQITPQDLEAVLEDGSVTAVYLTSPDYLGNLCPISALAEVCRRFGVLLLVDNAHGAYLKFLSPSLHPMDLGADLCCDSAHKTLPVLTGGAYLHIKDERKALINQAKSALALFGSTSPSYLILQSLDRANGLCKREFPEALKAAVPVLEQFKKNLQAQGFSLTGEEPLKVTILPKDYGYRGEEVANYLEGHGIFCEFADPDGVVLMFSPNNALQDCRRVREALRALPKKAPVLQVPPKIYPKQGAMALRAAALAPSEEIPADQSVGRILAAPTVGCPPAVPIGVCGEPITPQDLALFRYYGIQTLRVCLPEASSGPRPPQPSEPSP